MDARGRVLTGARRAALAIRDGWAILGIGLALLVGLELTYRAQASLRRWVSATPTTSASHPYADSAWYQEYRDEYVQSTVLEWRPYVYYRRRPFVGRHINIDSAQHRVTVQPGAGPQAPEVFFFGGSTMWGDYQRDAFTIPSVVMAQLARDGIAARGTNFGESGYVMAQGMLELIQQLRDGVRPDIVVFYDGINDVAAAAQSGVAGIPQNEFNRADEFRLGRAVRGWEVGHTLRSDARALGLLALTTTERIQFLQRLRIAVGSPSAQVPTDVDSLSAAVVRAYAGTVDVVEALARQYGFDALYVWQPNPHVSEKVPTAFETRIEQAITADPFQRRLHEVHERVALVLEDSVGSRASGRFMYLGQVFEESPAPVWVDDIGHTTEQAAGTIARSIASRVAELLRRR